MEYWEFLLQKEGDRSWLPLESPDVEILEGRYRVVARSSRADTSVEVRIMHQTTDEAPPKRRLQKRSGRTNQDGLMVVFPFTRLQPGLWEVRCSGDILSDFLGRSWQYSVRMQVLSQEHEGGEEWEPDWQQPNDGVIETSQTEIIATPAPLLDSQPDLTADPVPDALEQAEPALEPAIASGAGSANFQTHEPPDHPALTPVYSIDQLQHLAEQIAQTGNAAALASLSDTNTASTTAPPLEPVSAESTVTTASHSEETVENAVLEAPLAPVANVSPLLVQLTLDQTAYIARWGHSFTLSGFVELGDRPTEGAILDSSRAQTPWQGEVYLCLRDPQSAQVLVETRQTLSTQTLPYPFSCTVEIPLECRTRLLLGEVTLRSDSTAQVADEWATQEFTVTADLDELLEAIAADVEEDELLELPIEPPSPAEPSTAESVPDLTYLNLSFLGNAESAQRRGFHFQSSGGDPLPPQLYTPVPSEVPKTLDLPTVRKPQPSVPTAPPLTEPISEESPAEALHEDELAADLDLDHDEFLELGDATAVAAVEVGADVEPISDVEEETEPEDAIALEAEVAPTDPAFQSLKLQDRFWSRLNALAADAELSNWLQEGEPETDQPEVDEAIAAEIPTLEPEPTPEPTTSSAMVIDLRGRRTEDEWVAQEIVVDDEPDVPPQTPATPTEARPAALLAEDELVPTPKLEVPTGELVSGKPIMVRVRIPDLATRIYVKFWVNDRQTRSLLDGPRWLVDFTPTGLGDLEATTQLTVPFGSLEIQFEAIAVEMATQRESHKITAERMVIPPDAPSLSASEWG